MLAYSQEFLEYVSEKRKIKKVLNSEIITKKGRKLYLDFLCLLEGDTLLNIEFQFTGPNKYDLERFFKYNILSETTYGFLCESLIINPKTSKSGQKSRRIGKSKTSHPQFFYLGDIDFEKILNNIENKISNNIKLSSFDEISMMLMPILPKYKNKEEILKRICKIAKKEELFNEIKLDTFKAVIGFAIEKFLDENTAEKLKGELNMSPESQKQLEKTLFESHKKHQQLAEEEAYRQGKEEGIKEGIEKTAKNLKQFHTPKEISKITGLTLSTVLKL